MVISIEQATVFATFKFRKNGSTIWISAVAATVLGSTSAHSKPQSQLQSSQLPTPQLPSPQLPSMNAKETEQTFHRLAPTLPYFDTSTILYNRYALHGKRLCDERPANARVYAEINSTRHSKESLLLLLKDKDAKVRTLALAALYAKEEPKLLPDIAKMVDDHAPTYSEPIPVAMAVASNAPPPLEPKTVGQIAETITRFYLEAAGYYYGVKGSGQEAGFAQYWQKRKDRPYCASWFAVKLRRASTACSPTNQSRATEIKAVRDQIDKVPFPDRDWILLWLQTENGHDLLASEKDIEVALKHLGPDRLAQMLARKIDSSDPDLQTRKSNDYPYKNMMLCVLKHAKTCLRKDQVPLLVACDKWERAYQQHQVIDPLITPWFAISEAALDPKHADDILHKEFSRLDQDFYGFQKAELAEALWDSGGVKEIPFLLNCFYDPKSLYQNKQYSQFRPQWLREIKGNGRDKQTLFKALINDARFDKLEDCSALQALIEVTTKIAGHSTADPEQKDHAWHPLGVDRCCCDLEKALKEYPKETRELLDIMAKWRQQLKASHF